MRFYPADDEKPFFLRDGDDHWNATGQPIAANAMADYLELIL